jgi:hypothetical protein
MKLPRPRHPRAFWSDTAFERDRVAIDGKTGEPVADVTRYTYRDTGTRYVVSFEREKTILQAILTDQAPFLKRIGRLIGFDGAYHRFAGHAIWELMYFGLKGMPGLSGRRTLERHVLESGPTVGASL